MPVTHSVRRRRPSRCSTTTRPTRTRSATSIDGSPTISLVRFMSGKLRLYGNLSFIGVILKDVGLPRPAIQNIDELAVEVSPETITAGRR